MGIWRLCLALESDTFSERRTLHTAFRMVFRRHWPKILTDLPKFGWMSTKNCITGQGLIEDSVKMSLVQILFD